MFLDPRLTTPNNRESINLLAALTTKSILSWRVANPSRETSVRLYNLLITFSRLLTLNDGTWDGRDRPGRVANGSLYDS